MAARTPGDLPSLGPGTEGVRTQRVRTQTRQGQDGRLEERTWTERGEGEEEEERQDQRAWHTEEPGEEGESWERNPREGERGGGRGRERDQERD